MLAKREVHPEHQRLTELSTRVAPSFAAASRKTGILRSIWRHGRLVAILTAVALLPAIIYVTLATPQYTSTANLLIHRAAGSGGTSQNASTAALTPADLAAQRNVLISTPVLAAALAAPGVRDCDPLRDHHDIIPFLKHSLDVQLGNGDQISVSMTSIDPDDATCIVAAVVQSYSHFLSSLQVVSNSDALATLQGQKAAARADLAKQTADLFMFGQEHHVGAGVDVSSTGADELAKISQALNDSHLESVQARAADNDLKRDLAADPRRAEALKAFEASPAAANGIDDQELLRSELSSLKAQQGDLSERFMPGFPSLMKIQSRIDQLNLQLDAAIDRRAATAARREADLQTAYNDEQKKILDRAQQQTEYSRRSAEAAEVQKTIDQLNQRISNLNATNTAGDITTTVLDPATASLEPVSPKRQRILAVAALGGFLLSSLLALLLERRNAGPAGKAGAGLTMPILAELPNLPTDFSPLGTGTRALGGDSTALAEFFQGLNSVIETAKSRGRAVIVLITSPSRGDGKSTLVSNLAVSLAQNHQRVLVIDADLRSPSQSKIFGTGTATGLATLLEAEVSIPITAIHRTGTRLLDVIPGSEITRNPSELLNSQRFSDLLGDLAERYDYVLIDSPPTVTYTDARTISASCDITMMVARTALLSPRMIQIASDGLTMVGANLCGLVLNSGQDAQTSNTRLIEDASHIPAKEREIESADEGKRSGLLVAAARAIELLRAAVKGPLGIRGPAPSNGTPSTTQKGNRLLDDQLERPAENRST